MPQARGREGGCLNNGNRQVVLQPRDHALLRSLAAFRVLRRDQIAQLAGFGSVTRVNVRLSKLRKAKLVERYFIASETGGRASIYAITRKGARAVEVPLQPVRWQPNSVVIGNAFAAHQLALNDVRIAATKEGKTSVVWKTFDEPLSPASKLIPDGLIEITTDGLWHSLFLEVDLGTEALPTWTRKVRQYLQLATTGEFGQVVQGNRFAVLVIASSEARLRSLRAHVAKLTSKLFWFTTLHIIKQRGFWSPVWLRPNGDQQVPPGA